MGTLRKNVQFKGHAGFIQGIREPQGILHRHRGIVPGVKQEGGRGFRGDGLIQGGDGKGEDPAHTFQYAGIPQNQGIGLVSRQSTGSGRQVAPGGKAADGDFIWIQVPLRRVLPHQFHRAGNILQGGLEGILPADGIAQHKGLKPSRQIGQGHRLRLPVG